MSQSCGCWCGRMDRNTNWHKKKKGSGRFFAVLLGPWWWPNTRRSKQGGVATKGVLGRFGGFDRSGRYCTRLVALPRRFFGSLGSCGDWWQYSLVEVLAELLTYVCLDVSITEWNRVNLARNTDGPITIVLVVGGFTLGHSIPRRSRTSAGRRDSNRLSPRRPNGLALSVDFAK